jgi:hypothetical protein
MTLQVVVADPLGEAVPAEWDAFVTEQRLLSLWRSRLLTAAAWSAQSPTLLAVVRSAGGETLALFHARLLGVPGAPTRFLSPGTRPVGVLECRLHPVGSFPGYTHASCLSPAGRVAVTAAFERAVRGRLGARVLGVAYRHVADDELPLLRRAGRVCLRVQPEMILDNRWLDLDAYLAALPGRRRWTLRRNRQKVDADGSIQVRLEDTLPALEATRLLTTVRSRYRRALVLQPPVPVPYVDLLSQAADTRFLTYRDRDRRLLAFATIHDNGTELVSGYWGSLDPLDGGRPHIYFDAILRAVELMLSQGRRRLSLGKGMTEIKARYGATPSARYAVAGTR